MTVPKFCKPDEKGRCRFCEGYDREPHYPCPNALSDSPRKATKADRRNGRNAEFINHYGVRRSDSESLLIISNYCQWCPFYNQPKCACELCGCPNGTNAKNYVRLRERDCPAGKWTEAQLQRNLIAKPQKPT